MKHIKGRYNAVIFEILYTQTAGQMTDRWTDDRQTEQLQQSYHTCSRSILKYSIYLIKVGFLCEKKTSHKWFSYFILVVKKTIDVQLECSVIE